MSEEKRMIKLYLAGAMLEKEIVASYMRKFERQVNEQGFAFEIAIDWTDTQNTDQMVSEGVRFSASRKDLMGVSDSDVFWLLAPKDGGAGCWLELGYALANNRTVIISGAHSRTIFSSLAWKTFEEHEDAFKYIVDAGELMIGGRISFSKALPTWGEGF